MAEVTVMAPEAPIVVKPAAVQPLAVSVKPQKKVSSLAEKQAALKSVK